MADKCPNCGETLITRTIQKKLGLGSIDFPVAQICQKCNWSRDLTGAGDIVVKPPSPEKKAPDMNKFITIALALLVIAGIIWAFIPKGTEQPAGIQPAPSPAATPKITATAAATAAPISEVTPTGNKVWVRITRYKYVNTTQQNLKIKAGGEVIWVNDDSYPLTLVSKEGLFEDKILDNDKQISYIFKKIGTYNFDIVVLDVKKFSGTVVVEPYT
jgi:plastocyanin